MNIGKSLRLAMEKNDKSREQLASEIDRSVSYVNQLRRAESMNLDTVTMLAVAFDMKVSEFVALGE